MLAHDSINPSSVLSEVPRSVGESGYGPQLGEICGVTFPLVVFGYHSRSARPYVTMNLVQSGFRGYTSEREWE
jgi:hypothetical protein